MLNHRFLCKDGSAADHVAELLSLWMRGNARPERGERRRQMDAERVQRRLGLSPQACEGNSDLQEALAEYGDKICREDRPSCQSCVLISFCPDAQPEEEEKPPLVLDLFAGAGGLSLGFAWAGFSAIGAVEREHDAAQTYRFNHPGVPVLETDVAALSDSDVRELWGPPGRLDALIAGPPCQGYSAAGRRDPASPENLLFRHVTRLARILRPKSVLIENVPGVQRVNGVGFADRIRRSLHRSGYSADQPTILQADAFGVPQKRRRLIYLGRLSQLGPPLTSPDATHSPADASVSSLPLGPTLAEALAGLPELPAGCRVDMIDYGGVVLSNVATMKHSPKVVEKIAAIPPGGGPISYRRLGPVSAHTLVAGHRALPVHPWLDRAISVREAARIQGFPDTYVFAGKPANQPLQVANAVPPPMAEAIAVSILRQLGRVSEVPHVPA